MNYQSLTEKMRQIVKAKRTERMLVKINDPENPGHFRDIAGVEVSTFRDSGEENHVIFLELAPARPQEDSGKIPHGCKCTWAWNEQKGRQMLICRGVGCPHHPRIRSHMVL